MGRAFEYRKEKKFKRWNAMAKAFTKIGREIAMAVKQGGPDPTTNARLRIAVQNAKTVNMPKVNVENAIKKASSKDEKNFDEVVYEGYGPHGIAMIIETATDNPTRTVANVRMYLDRANGSLGTSGSVTFMFDRKGEFRVAMGNFDADELEFELIDHGCEEFVVSEGEIYIYTPYESFGDMQKALESKGIEVLSASLQRFPTVSKELGEKEREEIEKLLEKLDDDDDVQQVFHNMA